MHKGRSLLTVSGGQFEGPFDLLLELIQERRLDVSTLSLREITDDFLTYVRTRPISGELLGDFLVVAATLLLLKVRQLLPQLEKAEEEEVLQLTERLAAYRALRERAGWLQSEWGKRCLLSAGSFAPQSSARSEVVGGNLAIGASDLGQVMTGWLARLSKPVRVQAHLRARGKSFQDCVALFVTRLARLQRLVFQEVVAGHSQQEVAVSFLAVLELARQQRLTLEQQSFNQELVITRL